MKKIVLASLISLLAAPAFAQSEAFSYDVESLARGNEVEANAIFRCVARNTFGQRFVGVSNRQNQAIRQALRSCQRATRFGRCQLVRCTVRGGRGF